MWTGFSFDCNISDRAGQATGFNGCNPAIADKPDNGWEYGNHYAEIWPSARAAAWDAAEEGELQQTLNDIHAVHSVRTARLALTENGVQQSRPGERWDRRSLWALPYSRTGFRTTSSTPSRMHATATGSGRALAALPPRIPGCRTFSGANSKQTTAPTLTRFTSE